MEVMERLVFHLSLKFPVEHLGGEMEFQVHNTGFLVGFRHNHMMF
jgi:hypothetical protein